MPPSRLQDDATEQKDEPVLRPGESQEGDGRKKSDITLGTDPAALKVRKHKPKKAETMR